MKTAGIGGRVKCCADGQGFVMPVERGLHYRQTVWFVFFSILSSNFSIEFAKHSIKFFNENCMSPVVKNIEPC